MMLRVFTFALVASGVTAQGTCRTTDKSDSLVASGECARWLRDGVYSCSDTDPDQYVGPGGVYEGICNLGCQFNRLEYPSLYLSPADIETVATTVVLPRLDADAVAAAVPASDSCACVDDDATAQAFFQDDYWTCANIVYEGQCALLIDAGYGNTCCNSCTPTDCAGLGFTQGQDTCFAPCAYTAGSEARVAEAAMTGGLCEQLITAEADICTGDLDAFDGLCEFACGSCQNTGEFACGTACCIVELVSSSNLTVHCSRNVQSSAFKRGEMRYQRRRGHKLIALAPTAHAAARGHQMETRAWTRMSVRTPCMA